MSPPSWEMHPKLYAVAAFALAYYIVTTAYQWYRLRKVPGPFLAGFSSLWINWTFASGDASPYYDFAKKYGHLVRVGPNLLFTDDAEQLRKMSAARSTYGKDGAYEAAIKHPLYSNMFTTTDVPEHDRIKAKLLGPYSGRTTQGMEPIVDGFVTLLIKQMRSKIDTDKARPHGVVDLARFSVYFTMDVITRLAFGKEFGFMESDSDVFNLLDSLRVGMKIMWLPIVDTNVRAVMTSSLFVNTVGQRSIFGMLQRTCEEAVRRRYKPDAPEEKDLLGAFIKEGIPEGECISEMMVALAAGSDTTGSTIRNTMLHLITAPRVYSKLKETVAQAIADGLVSNPIKLEEAKKLPYLQAVIYEGIRIRPAAPVLFSKLVPPEGDTINGIFVPGGTAISWNLFPLMLSEEHWGSDAAMFRPERFMDADAKTRAQMERLVELAFGSGRFMCAGKPLAFMELNKVFFELFRHFDYQVVKPGKPWSSMFYTVFGEDDFFVELTNSPLASIDKTG